MSELNPEQMICERCQKSVPAGPFCFKCGKEQSVVRTQMTSSPHESHNVGMPVQVTDSVGTDDSIEQTGGTAGESHTKHSTMPRRTLSSPSTPEGVSANGNNDALYTGRSASFTVAMKPAGSSSQVEANIRSAVRTGVNDIINATEKLSKEENKSSGASGMVVHDRIQSEHVTVAFHAIIPKSVWEWSDHCRLGIRFIDEDDTEKIFKTDQRSWKNFDAIEVTAFINLPIYYTNRKIPYKYIVYYPGCQKIFWEYIHQLPVKGLFNRCLELIYYPSDITAQQMYHVYDGFIFPPEKWWNKIADWILASGLSTKESYRFALNIYLESVMLTMSLPLNHLINYISDKVCKIYLDLKQRRFVYYEDPNRVTQYNCVDQLNKALQNWIIETVNRLTEWQNGDYQTRVRCAGVTIALAIIIKETGVLPSNDHKALQVMFPNLCLETPQRKYIVELLDDSLRKLAADSIANICSISMAPNKLIGGPYKEWLYAVPLLHQLKYKDGITHDSVSFDPNEADWGTNGLDSSQLAQFKDFLKNEKLMKTLLEDLQNLTKDDHLLLRLLVYLSSEYDIDIILDHAPVHIVAVHLSILCQKYERFSSRKKRDKFSFAATALMQHLNDSVDGDDYRFHCTITATKGILDKMAEICHSNSEDMTVFYITLKLHFYALNAYVRKSSNDQAENVAKFITDIKVCITKCIQKPSFGYGERFAGKNSDKIKSEIEIWNNILAVCNNADMLHCLRQEWEEQIKDIIKNRMQVDVQCIIHIASEVVNHNMDDKIDHVLSDVIWNSVASVMESDTETKQAQNVMENRKHNIGTLLSTLLVKYHAKKDLTLEILLKFRLWPKYLKIYVSQNDEISQQFNEKCVRKCKEAVRLLSDISQRLLNANITVKELEMLDLHLSQAVKLFSPKVIEKVTDDQSFNIMEIVKKRMCELQKFKSYHFAVETVLDYCKEMLEQDDLLVDIQENLTDLASKENFLKLSIRALYEEIQGEEVYAMLTIDNKEVVQMLQPFMVLMHSHFTFITEHIWKCHVPKDTKLSLSQLAGQVWRPCFEEIQQLIEKLHAKSVTLKEIDDYFQNTPSQNLEHEICKLVEGFNLCLHKAASVTWVSQVVVSINHYRNIIEVQEVAELLLAAKNSLKVHTEFEELKRLKKRIESQADLPLEKVFEHFGGFEADLLKAITSNSKQMKFLKILSNAEDLIVWLRKETKNVTELQNLVRLSMFEGNAHTMDRIAMLHTVGSAIAPLVYELDQEIGLQKFLEVFKPVWKAVESDSNLCDSFEICCDELNFLKQTKDLQAPIEVSTYDEMKQILESGEYIISCKYYQIFHSTEEVISLKFKSCTGKDKTYTISDLKDLESKIVLIRDHRSNDQDSNTDSKDPQTDSSSSFENLSSKQIEDFLSVFHYILHIAETLLHLRRAGHPKYIKWFQSYPCKVTQDELQNKNSQMKDDLKDWLNLVSTQRKSVYVLNYFTCLQLLQISNELYCLITDPDHQINKKILLLLMSISPDLTIENIKNVTSSPEAKAICSASNSSLPLSGENNVFNDLDEIDLPTEVDNLSDEERDLYLSFTQGNDGFNPYMILTAIRKFGLDEDKILDFCADSNNIQAFGNDSVSTTHNDDHQESRIDITNPTVQELIRCNFSESSAIDAVSKCGEEIEDCMDYLVEQTLKENSNEITSEDNVDSNIEANSNRPQSSNISSHSRSTQDLSQEVEIINENPNFIDFENTGVLLHTIANKAPRVPTVRPFAPSLEKGTPNLLCVQPHDVFKTVISLYVRRKHKLLPLPSLEEVLICNEKTTVEEISLLWYRAVKDPDHARIFCLVNAERLSYQVCMDALEEMDKILKGEANYKLVIVCSNENKEERSYIMEHLQLSHRDASAVMAKDDVIHGYLKHHLSKNQSFGNQILASDVDLNKCIARVIRSERTGMGKSLYVKRLTNKLKKKLKQTVAYPLCVTIPIHGPNVDLNVVMRSLQHHANPVDPPPQIFHFDIAPTVLDNVNALLFSILILRGLNDYSGNVWRCFPQQLYVVEATYKMIKQDVKAEEVRPCTIEFLKFIPTVTCCSPQNASKKSSSAVYYDEKEVLSDQYQRPYQYLMRLSDSATSLDSYTFSKSSSKLSDDEFQSFLDVILRHFAKCGVTDPSWMELRHFLYFLNAQLEDCENSLYCGQYTQDVLPGFKKFVIKFMLKMSKDFAVPSLKIAFNKDTDSDFPSQHSNISIASDSFSMDSSPATISLLSVSDVSMDQPKPLTSTPAQSKIVDTSTILNSFEQASTGNIVLESSLTSSNSSDTEDTDFFTHDTSMTIEEFRILPSRTWKKNFHPYIFFNKDHTSMTFIGFYATSNGDLIDPADGRLIHRRMIPKDLMTGLKIQKVPISDDYSESDQEALKNKLLMVMETNENSRSTDSSYVLTSDNTKKILAILMRFRCNIPVVLMGETGCGKTRLIKYMCDLLSLNSSVSETLYIMKVHGGITEDDIVREVNKARKLAKINEKHGLETVMFFDEANTSEAIGLIKEIMCDNRIRGEPITEMIKFIAACNPYRKHSEKMIEKLENAGLGYYVKSGDTSHKLGNIPLRNLVYRVIELPSSMQSLVYDFGQLSSDTEKDYIVKIVEKYANDIPNLDITWITDTLMACQSHMRMREDECSFVSLRDIERAMIVMKWFYSMLDHIEKDDVYAASNTEQYDHQTRALILSVAVCYYAKLQCRDDFEKFISPLLIPLSSATDASIMFKEEIRKCQEVFLNNMKIPPNIARNTALRENVFMMVVCIELKIPLFLVGKPGSSKSLAKSIVADSMQGAASSSSLFQWFKQVQLFSYQCSQHSTSETILEVFKNATHFQEKKKGQNCVSVVVLDEVGLAEDSPSLPLKSLHPLLEDGTTESKTIADRVAFIGISNWALDPAKMNRGIMVTRNDPSIEELHLSAKGICSSNNNNEVCSRLEFFFTPFAEAYITICKEQIKTGKEFFGLRDFYSLIKMMYWISQNTGKHLTLTQLRHCLMRNFGGADDINKIVETFLEKVSANRLELNESPFEMQKYDCSSSGLIKASLQTKDTTWHGENRYLLFLTENYSALRILLQMKDLIDHDPLVLFGSSFPRDINYTQVCRSINQIKFCMDTGRTVILLNLEHLYASLYDVLNQYYITLSNTRYVDLGLQTHRIKCRVHPSFKLVLIANKDKVYEEFPTPLINRLEKHFLVTSTMLSQKQGELVNKIKSWVEDFSRVSATVVTFHPEDAFVGYQSDTPASIVFKVWQDLEGADHNKEEVLFLKSKEYLLKMATPDAVARSKLSKLFPSWNEISGVYFAIHSYSFLGDFLQEQLQHTSVKGKVLQITTHTSLLQLKNLPSLLKATKFSKEQVTLLTLQQFDTEVEFSNVIRSVFWRKSKDPHILIIQCNTGHQHTDLIACARHRVIDEQTQSSRLNILTHIIFIIGLPRQRGGTKFFSFQGGNWESYHIDSLITPKDSLVTIKSALNMSINDILSDCYEHNTELLYRRLQNWISLSLLHFNNVQIEQKVLDRFNLLSLLIKQSQIGNTDQNDVTKLDAQKHTSAFWETLLQRAFRHLKTKKDTQPELNKQEWAIREAMNSESIHESESYINALSLKVDRVMANALNNILNAVDRYYNLHLLQSDYCTISSLWITLFEEMEIVLDATFGIDNTGSDHSNAVFASFKCQFPFFWLFVNSIEQHWKISPVKKTLDVYNIVKSDLIAEKLLKIKIDDIEEIFKCYIHDYVLYSCGSSEENDDTKVIIQIVGHEHEKMTKDKAPDNLLLYQMILLHETYQKLESQLQHLKQITTLNSDVSTKLQAYFKLRETDIGIDLYAVQESLSILKPKFNEWSADDCKQWLYAIHNYQNTIDATIIAATKSQGMSTTSKKIRKDWQLLRVLQIFVEHTIDIVPSVTLIIAKRMQTILERNHDFSKLVVYTRLKKLIDSYAVHNDIRYDLSIREKARNACCMLFMEIVTEVIFAVSSTLSINEQGKDDLPEDDLVAELIKTVTPSNGLTKPLSPLTDNEADKTPVLRSYLLQLLLDYDLKNIRGHLQQYFSNSCDMLQEDTDFLVLCTQCFEDALHKQARSGSLSNAVQLAIDSHELAKHPIFDDNLKVATLGYVENVAKLRYVLVTVACLLHDYYIDSAKLSLLSADETNIVGKLLASIQKTCLAIDETTKYAFVVADFLIKCIVRKYGMSTLLALCEKEKDFQWLIPKHLQKDSCKSQQNKVVDPFVIYGKDYTDIRNDLAIWREETASNATTKANTWHVENNNGKILLSLYSIITMSHYNELEDNDDDDDDDDDENNEDHHDDDEDDDDENNDEDHDDEDDDDENNDEDHDDDDDDDDDVNNGLKFHSDSALDDLQEQICKEIFSSDSNLRNMALQLIYNFQKCPTSLLSISSERSLHDLHIHAIVVHTAVVIMCNRNNSLLNELHKVIQLSPDVKKMYLPTMPHDELYGNAAIADIGRIYKCKNGHPFIVTECGRPMELSNCHICNEPIGGQWHVLTEGNVEYEGEDTTQTGHLLGPVQHLSKQATPERRLSSVACTITRSIIHATLIWSSMCIPDSLDFLTEVIHPAINAKDVPLYFWKHVMHDIDLLSKVIGHSIDEAALVVHLILQQMYDSTYNESNFDLMCKESRDEWEMKFNELYIQPIISNIDSVLKNTQELIINDDSQAQNALLQVVYEKNKDENPAAPLWRYRSRITIEHLEFFIDQQSKSENECPVLKEFLKEEVKLRATQYLPDIIQLQKILYDKYNYYFDEEEVSKQTVKDLQQNTADTRCIKMVESFYKAWTLVKSFLPTYGRNRVPKEVIIEMPSCPQDIPLVYLIPTSTGRGLCSTALVDFLVTTHNDFITFYHSKIEMKALKQTLPLRDLQSCYLVADKQQFMTIVMSHCHYSLTRGKGTEVHYDIQALERHFLSRFVHGRPLFDVNSANIVIQSKYIHSSKTFRAIRKTICPQRPISPEAKRAIMNELKDSNRLREVIEVVNIILAILAKPATTIDVFRPIDEYAKEVLNQTIVTKDCTLQNILSLWETLAVEQSKRAVLAGQDIFKDIGTDFKQPLDLTKEEVDKFYDSLKKFHTDQLLGALYQFIVLFVPLCYNKDWPLVDTFPVFLEQEQMEDVTGLGVKFKSSIPKSIALSHVVDVWKRIVMHDTQAADK